MSPEHRARRRIRIANTRDAPAPHNTAYAHFPAPWAEGGDVWFERSGDDPVAGNYDFMTIIHEIGHALGLKHPHETYGFPEMPIGADAIEFTVMSYRTYIGDGLNGYDAEEWGFPQTYMMLDIAALQHMYGADFGTRAGNTTYAWDPETGTTTVGGEVAIAPGGNRVFLTVWDGGGVDRYDFSAYKTGVDADLAPGGHSVLSTKQLADLGGGPNGGLRARQRLQRAAVPGRPALADRERHRRRRQRRHPRQRGRQPARGPRRARRAVRALRRGPAPRRPRCATGSTAASAPTSCSAGAAPTC